MSSEKNEEIMSSVEKKDLISGEERRANKWNIFQREHRGLKKEACRDLYKVKKPEGGPSKTKAPKFRIRGKWNEFCVVLSKLTQHQKQVIATTPFSSLLALEKGGLSIHVDLIKSIVNHVNSDNMTLTIREGGETQDFPITHEDFSNIMCIQSGSGQLVGDSVKLDNDLLDKFCILSKNNTYKYIDLEKVKDVLKEAADDNDKDKDNDNAIKQAFALLAMRYIVCPPSADKLGKKYLWYVKDVASLHDQPWANIAISALQHGIETYNKGKGVEKNLGGSVLFLQLYCMKRRGFMEKLGVSEISKEVAEKFYKNWMLDHAPEIKGKKQISDKICKDMNKISRDLKHLSDHIKVKSEKVGLKSLLEFDEFNELCKNKIAAITGELFGSDKAASSATEKLSSDDKAGASTSGAKRIRGVRSVYYPNRKDKRYVEIFYDDLHRLEPRKWMNDNLMNFYLRYLELHASPTNGAITDYYFFNTYFYTKLTEVLSTKENADKFKKWWDRDNILQKEYIVIPIHGDSHWSVVIVCMGNKIDKSESILLHLDSYCTHDATQIFDNIKRFMEEELNCGVNDTVICEVPQQQNDYDCGLYSLLFIEYFIRQAPNRMETEYTTMFGKKWFQEKEVGDLRGKMKSMLEEIIERDNLVVYSRLKKQKTCGEESEKKPKAVSKKKPNAVSKLEKESLKLGFNPHNMSNLNKRVLRKGREIPTGS